MEENNYFEDDLSKSKSQEDSNSDNNFYFNSITGEAITTKDGEEENMYEVVPDLAQYARDNITQYIDICEKDKHFFNLWNSFIKSKEDDEQYNLEEMIIEFLKIHSKEIYENQLRKNFIMHLVAVYDNNQINDEDLVNIIDIMDKIFEQYDKH